VSEKEKKKLLEQINKLTPKEFSKLCLEVVKKIVNKKPSNETIENHIEKPDKEVLINLMIENDIKIKKKRKNNENKN